jgi:hypothetical protein
MHELLSNGHTGEQSNRQRQEKTKQDFLSHGFTLRFYCCCGKRFLKCSGLAQ